MKTKAVIGLTLLFLGVSGMALAEAPHQIGGFVLNQNIKKFAEQVIMDTALPVRYAENIEEVENQDLRIDEIGLMAITLNISGGQALPLIT